MKYNTFRAIVAGSAVVIAGALTVIAARSCGGPQSPTTSADPAKGAAPGVSPVVDGAPAAQVALRPMDREILDAAKQELSDDKMKDAVRGRDYKVNLYKDAGQARINRAKVDLDRDEKWDEKWTFPEGGGEEGTKRQIAPGDDEKYTVEYRLRGGSWVLKK